MRTHVVAVHAALEDVIVTAQVALIDLEGVEARIDEDAPSAPRQRSKRDRSKRIRKALTIASCAYILFSAVSTQAQGPFQALPSWTLDSKVHLIARTDRAVDSFYRG